MTRGSRATATARDSELVIRRRPSRTDPYAAFQLATGGGTPTPTTTGRVLHASADATIYAALDAVYFAAIEARHAWLPILEVVQLESSAPGPAGAGDGVREVRWRGHSGEYVGIEGVWRFRPAGPDATWFSSEMTVDLGRGLRVSSRSRVAGLLRRKLVEAVPARLKAYVEGTC